MVPILYCVSIISVRHAVSVAASNAVVLEGNTISLDGAMDKFDRFGILLSGHTGAWSNRVRAIHSCVDNARRAGTCIGKVSDVIVPDSVITSYRRSRALFYEDHEAKNYGIVNRSWKVDTEIKMTNGGEDGECKTKKGRNVTSSGSSVSKCKGSDIEQSSVCCLTVCSNCGGVGCWKCAPYSTCCERPILRCCDEPPWRNF